MNHLKHHQTFPYLLTIITAAAGTLLAACGGGGGGGGGSALPVVAATTPPAVTPAATTPAVNSDTPVVPPVTPAATAADVANPSTIATTVVAPTYPSASEQAAAFSLLNAERVACGFGAVAQSTQLDTAAAGHAKYLLADNYGGHYQDAGTPNFTGNSPLDRATAAGYTAMSIVDLNTSISGVSDLTGRGIFSVRSLLSAPYHLPGMTAPLRDIGISIMSSDQAGSTATYGKRTVEQYDLATTTAGGYQLPSGSDVLSYPCNGSTGTFFEVVNESPNPVPGRDLLANPLGQSIFLSVRKGQTITIASASMRVSSATGAAVTLRTPMTSSNDPNLELQANQAVLMPDVALAKNTSYYVEVHGTNNGVNFNKTLTFTTGTGTGRI